VESNLEEEVSEAEAFDSNSRRRSYAQQQNKQKKNKNSKREPNMQRSMSLVPP
jgi:hypothetical protein